MKKTIQVNKMSIELYESGDPSKQTLVFAHGLGANLLQWERQFEYFKEFHIVAISLQGHGKSDKRENVYSIEDYLETYLELFEVLSIKDCIWIGNSMGGVLGYAVMKRKPLLITKLIINGTSPKLMMPKILLKMIYMMDKLLISFIGFEGYVKFAANHVTQYDMIKPKIFEMFRMTTAQTIVVSHQVLGQYDYLETLKETSIPVLIIKSPNDKEINRYLNKYNEIFKLNHVTTVEVKDTGHICNMERPDEYNKLVMTAIQGGTID